LAAQNDIGLVFVQDCVLLIFVDADCDRPLANSVPRASVNCFIQESNAVYVKSTSATAP
jgi:hypothetical protein